MHTNRNSHTTSTKCQYQAAASKPKCRSGVKCAGVGAEQADDQEAGADDHVEAVKAGGQEERRRIDAAAHQNLNGAFEYSIAWHIVKHMPSTHRQRQTDHQTACRSRSSSE